jgi:hypothetical protein
MYNSYIGQAMVLAENKEIKMEAINTTNFAALVIEVASISFYGKDRIPAGYAAAVAKMESHPDYPAYKAKVDAENEVIAAKKIADDKALDDFLA